MTDRHTIWTVLSLFIAIFKNSGTSGNPGTGKKSVEAVAKEVIAGKWGKGGDRKKRLQAAGYDYGAVQRKVNELMR